MKKYLIISSFISFIGASILHFAYEFFNEAIIVGAFAPINESIFEHTKLLFIPLLISQTIYFLKNKYYLNYDSYWFYTFISIIIGIYLMPATVYFYSSGFLLESLIADILLCLIIIGISNFIFYISYNNFNFNINYKKSIFLIIILFIIYFILTIYPPNYPFFISN